MTTQEETGAVRPVRAGKDRSIILPGPSVLAAQQGQKTQHRIVLSWQPDPVSDYTSGPFQNADGVWGQTVWEACGPEQFCPLRLPALSGERLWVRETWCRDAAQPHGILYRADGTHVVLDDGDGFTATNRDGSERSPWRSPVHMPREFSRLTLIVEAVKVERLQDISEEDAIAEGVWNTLRSDGQTEWRPPGAGDFIVSARHAFFDLWGAIHGPDAWAANPWVAAIRFKCIPQHIDSLANTPATPPEAGASPNPHSTGETHGR